MEMLATFLFLQPAVLAYRVAMGGEQDKGSSVSPQVELLLSRGADIVAESLPSGTLQIYALLISKQRSKVALASIVISAMTTGFVGTSVAWDRDTDPHNRKVKPSFYGYIKNDPTSRTLTFLVMFSVVTSHVLMRTLATALLLLVDKWWLLFFMIGEMSIFMIFKFVSIYSKEVTNA